MSDNKKTIAIVGGGVSGLYLAWRLQQLLPPEGFAISLYEKEEELGGRIRTCDIQITEEGREVMLSAELGAMRYPNRHVMISSLVKRLGLEDEAARESPSGNGEKGPFDLEPLFYVRGQVLRKEDFRDGRVPYCLREEEKGRTPEDLLQFAIGKALEQISLDPPDQLAMKRIRERVASQEPIKPCEWMALSSCGVFDGIRLHDIGFWNLIKHFLSSEAFLLCQDGFGFLSVISNWNAAEAFKWLIADFSPDQHFLNVRGGFSRLIEGLSEEIDGQSIAVATATVRSIEWRSGRFRLEFSDRDGCDVDYVVMALPPRAMQRIEVKEVDRVDRDAWLRLFKSSRPHRLEKIVLVYREPWWKGSGIPAESSGRVFTDLPMRQIYYLDPEWLSKSGLSEAQDYSLVLIYNDSLYEGFWRTFSVYKRVHVVGDISQEEWLTRALGPLPRKVINQEIDVKVKGGEEVRYRLEEKIRAQLKELHKTVKVPVAIAGVYKDWADEGGWHTWEPFVDVAVTKKVIIQPFRESDGKLKICAPDEPHRLPLFVCGEAYAWEQGWVEGALMSAEALVAEMSQTLVSSYRTPEWINKLGWRDYMAPEYEACPSHPSLKKYLGER